MKQRRKRLESIKVLDLNFPLHLLNNENFGFSQTLIKEALQCDYRLLYQLNKWSKPGKEENFFYGEVVHEMLDIIYSLGRYPGESFLSKKLDSYLDAKKQKHGLIWISPQKLEYYKGVILVVLDCYFQYYVDDFSFSFIEVERNFKVKFENFNLIGKCDGKFEYREKRRKKKMLLEHKTKTKILEKSLDDGLDMDFQNKYYLLADYIESGTWCDGVLYNVIRRPQTKQHKDESLKEYCDRLRNDINTRPEHYFKRWEAFYTQTQLSIFTEELFEKLIRIENLMKGKSMLIHNESQCIGNFECEYLNACVNGNMKGYKQRKHISPELAA